MLTMSLHCFLGVLVQNGRKQRGEDKKGRDKNKDDRDEMGKEAEKKDTKIVMWRNFVCLDFSMKIYNQIYKPVKQDHDLKEIMTRKELMWGNGI